MDLPESTSEPADWGTVCHEISEICLREGKQADDFIGQTRKGKKFSFEVDEEMAETAQLYIDYVRRSVLKAAPKGTNPASLLQIEQRFSLAAIGPPFDAGGMGDAVIYYPVEEMIEVVDLKGGRGVVVEAKGNKQGRSYGLGAILANPKLKVKRIKVTIVQPRAGHVDGRIRDETFEVADLVDWTTELLEKMHQSKEAIVAKSTMPMAAWSAKYLSAGDHCGKTFCKAAGFCPALEQRALDAAGVWFDDLDQPRISNSPDTLSPERASQLLDAADMIGDWINAVRAYWHAEAESGVEIPNYILVPKEGREKFNDDASAKLAAAKAEAAGLPAEKVWNDPKPRTPKQIRDALIKAKLAAVADELKELSSSESKGTNLVRTTKTTRAAVTPSVHKHLSNLDSQPNVFD
jgi:hypothetical protein